MLAFLKWWAVLLWVVTFLFLRGLVILYRIVTRKPWRREHG
jgi:hypothetical protein